MVLVSHLHLLYVSVPYDQVEILNADMTILAERLLKLSTPERDLCTRLGVTELQLQKEIGFQGASRAAKNVMRRLALAMVLRDLWDQHSIWDVSKSWNIGRGAIQNLLQGAAAFAGALSRFCEGLPEFWALSKLLPDFARQLTYCINADLIPLMELQGVRHARAKQLYEAGYRSIGQITTANPHTLIATRLLDYSDQAPFMVHLPIAEAMLHWGRGS